MPSVLYDIRLMMTAAALSAALATGGCGSKEQADNATEVQMKGLETVDGTINDAMTDLDGVQSEGVAVADTGTGNSGNAPASPAGSAKKDTDETVTSDTETEVVADQ